jgi:ankyrin repeat protein
VNEIPNGLEIVKFLLSENADPQARSNKGWTVLHVAASYRSLDTVKYLVEAQLIGKLIVSLVFAYQ